ncbi:molybdopterin cofactor-binding domain-containing protein [Kaarinaea lacus]
MGTDEKIHTFNISRRRFLVTSVSMGAGLTLGVHLVACSERKVPETQALPEAGPGKAGGEIVSDFSFEPNAFVRIEPDNTVTVIMKHFEMGQGTYTGLATLVAEELDAAWNQVQVQAAPANAKLYNNLFWGPMQGTGGSTAIANSFEQMRKAGAAARQMLVTAAAKQWNVPADEIIVQDGTLSHKNPGKSATFGDFAELAAKEPVPQEVFLKSPDEFRLIGKDLPRKDSNDKCTGKALYTQDVKLPGMLTAVVAHPPRFGATVKSFDATESKKVKGVVDVLQIPTGVAVLANDTWSAMQGRNALKVEWDESEAFKKSSSQLMEEYKAKAKQAGAVARKDGDVDKAMSSAVKTLSAAYEFPYLAHAAMEPLNCVVQIKDNACEIWNAAQTPTADQMAISKLLGINVDQVKINTFYAGGSFGRRANPLSDYVLEAANIAKALGNDTPVKMIWTREDDMRAGYYRPMYYHEIKAGLDKEGNPVAWQHRIVGQSILTGTAFEPMLVKNGIDATSVEGASNLPYAIPNLLVDLHTVKLPVPVQWWRSVGSTHTAYSTETFLDELAHAANKDPVEYRRALLKNHPRHLGVMELAAEKAGWGGDLPEGKGRGIAVHESFNSYVAEVAEVSVNKDNTFNIDRVVIAVDCGFAVNPDVVKAQMEGGMGFGLSTALSSAITLNDGQVEQSNFFDYIVLRMNQMPKQVEVHIVKSDQPPTGVGEPATPVIAPAVANALFNATGKRFYKLPIKLI